HPLRKRRAAHISLACMTTRFWLIRHGEPEETTRGRCYGSLDVGLSDHGRSQMRRVAAVLKAHNIDATYTSPRRRAIESAAQLNHPHAARVIEDFREMDFGDFEGRAYDEIASSHPELYRQWMEAPTEVQFPNGESFQIMRRRVLHAFTQL